MSPSETGWIRERLDVIVDALNELKVAMATVHASCPVCREDIDDLKTTIYGNGREGLKSDVERLQIERKIGIKAIVAIASVASAIIAAGVGAALEAWLRG